MHVVTELFMQKVMASPGQVRQARRVCSIDST
jgi:hypothetical protein